MSAYFRTYVLPYYHCTTQINMLHTHGILHIHGHNILFLCSCTCLTRTPVSFAPSVHSSLPLSLTHPPSLPLSLSLHPSYLLSIPPSLPLTLSSLSLPLTLSSLSLSLSLIRSIGVRSRVCRTPTAGPRRTSDSMPR